ncbi:MAG: copper homeostasis protein CutC [Erysipelotrichaceae bacterium]|nr:copper homeostasis protein CutC [Erysipelotrichaceae bacterium]
MKRIVEICCGSYEDALNAYRGGAKRIELNSALYLGGLTPSLASLILTKQNTDLEVICMVRSRGAGFCYSENEFEVMKYDAKLLMEKGSDGLAFGFLDMFGNIDIDKTKQMIDIVKFYHGTTVFHRAFDCVSNPFEAIEILIDLGVDRVLTSGLENKAIDGLELIKDLQEKYAHQIQILAGSGINVTNAKTMMDETGIYQVHSSCKDWINDPTTSMNHVSYAYASSPHKNDYDVVSKQLVEELIKSI